MLLQNRETEEFSPLFSIYKEDIWSIILISAYCSAEIAGASWLMVRSMHAREKVCKADDIQ